MNGGVWPQLMSQLIKVVLSVSVGSWWSQSSSVSQRQGRALDSRWTAVAPRVHRLLCNEERDGGTDLHTLRLNASGYYFSTAVMPREIM